MKGDIQSIQTPNVKLEQLVSNPKVFFESITSVKDITKSFTIFLTIEFDLFSLVKHVVEAECVSLKD